MCLFSRTTNEINVAPRSLEMYKTCTEKTNFSLPLSVNLFVRGKTLKYMGRGRNLLNERKGRKNSLETSDL